MSTSRPTTAKIIQHSSGMGTPSPELVRHRAKELALINGHEEMTEDDWRQAKRELHGGHPENENNGENDMIALVSEADMMMVDPGHHVERVVIDDDEHVVEELIAEGMDEAEHEQMLASRMQERDEDEELE